MQNQLKTYLSGATKQVKEDFQSWRSYCKMLSHTGYYEKIKFVDPLAYFNYKHRLPKTEKQCIDLFMWLIDQCNILLVNLDYSNTSIGTGQEIEHAFCHSIPIIGFGEKPDTWYNWSAERCSVIFDTIEEAVEYINNNYGGVL